jgi:hypothetical protein
LLGEHAILLIHVAADLAADDSANDGTDCSRSDLATATAELIAEKTACNGANGKAGIGLVRAIRSACDEHQGYNGYGDKAQHAHG